MAIRYTSLGGTNYNNESITDSDLNDTNNFIANTIKEINIARYGDSVLSGCEITEQDTPNQTAQMSAGKILVNGLYCSIGADASISFTNADGSNPRYDLVSIDSSGNITVTAGTASATPVMPTLPVDEVPLAYVYRTTSDNTINSADITDCRRLIDGFRYFDSTASASSNSSTGWTLLKTITIPAFVAKKYLIITIPCGGVPTAMSSSIQFVTNSETANAPAMYINVNGINKLTNTSFSEAYDNSTYGNFVNNGSLGFSYYIDSSDADWDSTQPTIIKIYGYSHEWAGSTNAMIRTCAWGVYIEGE